MTDVYPALFFGSLPWWIGAPLLQLAILGFGMALDETYVNRVTVFTGAVAVYVHALVAGDVGLFVGLYLDIGLIVGAYGVYAYIVDAYVANWFRVIAFFVYSPLAVFLVILTAGFTLVGVELLFIPALAISGFINLQLMAALAPNDPYYFGPESPVTYDEPSTTETPETDSAETVEDEPAVPYESEPGEVGAGEPSTAGGDPAERGILPSFMRRL